MALSRINTRGWTPLALVGLTCQGLIPKGDLVFFSLSHFPLSPGTMLYVFNVLINMMLCRWVENCCKNPYNHMPLLVDTNIHNVSSNTGTFITNAIHFATSNT